MNNLDEKFLFASYRSSWLNFGVLLLTAALSAGGLFPEMFDRQVLAVCSGVLGLVLAGLVIWASECLLVTNRALSLEDGKIVELTCFSKWFDWQRVQILASFEDISLISVEQRFNLGSRYHNWTYPVVLHTQDGRQITLANGCATQNRGNYSIPLAKKVSDRLGCDLVYHQEADSDLSSSSGFTFHIA